MSKFHTPVLTAEVLKYLEVKPGKLYLDATIGGGGHSAAIIKSGGRVLGIDTDPDAILETQTRLSDAYPATQGKTTLSGPAEKSFQLVNDNFTNLEEIAAKHQISRVSGILFDLGASTHQLTSPSRGFSFSADNQLDMRMNPHLSVTAKDLINGLGKNELYKLFTKYAQEKRARAIANAIVISRRQEPIETTKQLAQTVERIYGGKRTKLHPATKVFQALRIAVNDELNNLESTLPRALKLLEPGGRLVVISFHQGEDRLVKTFIKQQAINKQLINLTPKPITPSLSEIQKNPNSRSAKLRAAQKI